MGVCGMTAYQVCDLTVESDLPLPELTQAKGKEPECAFRLLRARRVPGAISRDWFHHWRRPDGEIWLSCARQGSGYLLRFTDLADFLVSPEGSDIRCYPVPDTPLETIRHLLLDQVIPLFLSVRGRLVLHASAVVVPGGAIAFLGETGQGKSTLSGSFVTQGFPLVTDDCLLLQEAGEHLIGHPSYPGLRLWPDSVAALFGQGARLCHVAHYTEKERLGPDDGPLPFCADPAPLQRVYVLASYEETEETKAITLAPLSPREAFMELVKHTFRLDIIAQERLSEEFERVARVVALLPVCRLAFPQDLSLLPTVREAILANLSGR
jgi:hypothetical protein